MSKKRNELPTMTTEEPMIALDENETATPIPEPGTVTAMTVDVPFLNWETGFIRRRLDCSLTHEQARKLKGIQLGLETREARLQNGKYVNNSVDALRWILENVEADVKTS